MWGYVVGWASHHPVTGVACQPRLLLVAQQVPDHCTGCNGENKVDKSFALSVLLKETGLYSGFIPSSSRSFPLPVSHNLTGKTSSTESTRLASFVFVTPSARVNSASRRPFFWALRPAETPCFQRASCYMSQLSDYTKRPHVSH